MNPIFFNLSKRKKHDILSELLMGKSTEGIISQKEINAVNRLIEDRPLNNAPVEINDQPPKTKKFTVVGKDSQKTKNVTDAAQKIRTAKKKKTHYLSQEISENLDKTQITIRSLVPENLRYRISKSLIVNKALAMILQEFKAEGKNSRLMRSIIQKT